MDAETYVKTVKRICESSFCHSCPLADKDEYCAAALSYTGNKNPVPAVEQWLKDDPEPLPELPDKLICNKGNIEARTLNAIIDYLAAREDNNGRA